MQLFGQVNIADRDELGAYKLSALALRLPTHL
jgi:hypothetical protein